MTDAARSGLVLYGVVSKPHGLDGSVKVTALSGDASALASLSRVFVNATGADGGRQFRIKNAKVAGSSAVLSLEGVGTVEDAGALRGARLFVEEKDLPEPEEGEYYNFRLIGLAVTDGGAEIGTVKEIVQSGLQSVLVAEGADGRETLIPMVEKFIEEIDIERGTVAVRNVAMLAERE